LGKRKGVHSCAGKKSRHPANAGKKRIIDKGKVYDESGAGRKDFSSPGGGKKEKGGFCYYSPVGPGNTEDEKGPPFLWRGKKGCSSRPRGVWGGGKNRHHFEKGRGKFLRAWMPYEKKKDCPWGVEVNGEEGMIHIIAWGPKKTAQKKRKKEKKSPFKR